MNTPETDTQLTSTRQLAKAKAEARRLLDHHQLHDWTVVFDHARRRAGQCRYQRKEISLSRHFVIRNTWPDIVDTILHEIAHALVGPGHGHDRVWKRMAVQIGARPQRCAARHVQMPAGVWKATCPVCNCLHSRHRRPPANRKFFCRPCGRAGALTFQKQP
jgi:predicted SprT family Zn-dependent metalloprotease